MSQKETMENKIDRVMKDKEKAEAEKEKWRKKAISAQNRVKAYKMWLAEKNGIIEHLTEYVGQLNGKISKEKEQIKILKERLTKLQ